MCYEICLVPQKHLWIKSIHYSFTLVFLSSSTAQCLRSVLVYALNLLFLTFVDSSSPSSSSKRNF